MVGLDTAPSPLVGDSRLWPVIKNCDQVPKSNKLLLVMSSLLRRIVCTYVVKHTLCTQSETPLFAGELQQIDNLHIHTHIWERENPCSYSVYIRDITGYPANWLRSQSQSKRCSITSEFRQIHCTCSLIFWGILHGHTQQGLLSRTVLKGGGRGPLNSHQAKQEKNNRFLTDF